MKVISLKEIRRWDERIEDPEDRMREDIQIYFLTFKFTDFSGLSLPSLVSSNRPRTL